MTLLPLPPLPLSTSAKCPGCREHLEVRSDHPVRLEWESHGPGYLGWVVCDHTKIEVVNLQWGDGEEFGIWPPTQAGPWRVTMVHECVSGGDGPDRAATVAPAPELDPQAERAPSIGAYEE